MKRLYLVMQGVQQALSSAKTSWGEVRSAWWQYVSASEADMRAECGLYWCVGLSNNLLKCSKSKCVVTMGRVAPVTPPSRTSAAGSHALMSSCIDVLCRAP